MTTVSHVRNKSSVGLPRVIFDRTATLIPPKEYVLPISALPNPYRGWRGSVGSTDEMMINAKHACINMINPS